MNGPPRRRRRFSPAKKELGIEFDVTIEIPKGTRNKYEMDPKAGRIRLDRTLFTATQYPADFGFVDHSLGEDGDPLDALVLVREPTFPGCLIRCRAIGMFRMWDNTRPDPTVLCVPTADPRLAHLADITDLEHFYKLEIQHFFHVYQDLEPGRRIDVEHGIWASRTDAEAEVKRSQDRCPPIDIYAVKPRVGTVWGSSQVGPNVDAGGQGDRSQ